MAKHVIQAQDGAPPLGAYSHGWRAGGFIYVTGTGPIGPDGKVVGETIEEQTHQTIDNVAAVLRAEGASLSDVIKVNVHLIDTNLFPRYNEAYQERFSPPVPGPDHSRQRPAPGAGDDDRDRGHRLRRRLSQRRAAARVVCTWPGRLRPQVRSRPAVQSVSSAAPAPWREHPL